MMSLPHAFPAFLEHCKKSFAMIQPIERFIVLFCLATNIILLPFLTNDFWTTVYILIIMYSMYVLITIIPIALTHPRIGLLLRIFYVFCLALYTCDLLGSTAFDLTPFPPIDPWLKAFDNAEGFYTNHVLAYMHAHPSLNKFLWFIYHGLIYQFGICLLILGLMGESERFYRFIVQLLICSYIGIGFAFFFPSIDPAYSYNHLYFQSAQTYKAALFEQLHHLIPNIDLVADKKVPIGTVDFPSFHVIFTVLLTYTLRPWKALFLPACLYSFLIMISTLTTGWHYFADVLGGFTLACLSIAITYYLFKYFNIRAPKMPWTNPKALRQFNAFSLRHKIDKIILDIGLVMVILGILVIAVHIVL